MPRFLVLLKMVRLQLGTLWASIFSAVDMMSGNPEEIMPTISAWKPRAHMRQMIERPFLGEQLLTKPKIHAFYRWTGKLVTMVY